MPMLSSGQAGECAAAAAAIDRLLKANGLDWHDLTSAIVSPGAASPPPTPDPTPSSPFGDNPGAVADDLLCDAINAIQHSGVRLSASSEAFLNQLQERAYRYGTVYFSDKQWKWFTDLMTRAGARMQ